MLANVQTFCFFLFGYADSSEKASDDLPGDQTGYDCPDRVGRGTEGLDTQLLNTSTDDEAKWGTITLDVLAPQTDHKSPPDTAGAVNGERTNWIIDSS